MVLFKWIRGLCFFTQCFNLFSLNAALVKTAVVVGPHWPLKAAKRPFEHTRWDLCFMEVQERQAWRGTLLILHIKACFQVLGRLLHILYVTVVVSPEGTVWSLINVLRCSLESASVWAELHFLWQDLVSVFHTLYGGFSIKSQQVLSHASSQRWHFCIYKITNLRNLTKNFELHKHNHKMSIMLYRLWVDTVRE